MSVGQEEGRGNESPRALTDSRVDRRQEVFPTIRLDPPSVWVPLQRNLPFVHLSLQPQTDLAVTDQARCDGHVQVQHVALVPHVENVPGVSGARGGFGFGNERCQIDPVFLAVLALSANKVNGCVQHHSP